MANTNHKEIFFHVGTGKTGSTFLQMRVFPKITGITYMPTNRYRKVFEFIDNCDSERILISREFDRQFEKEVVRFSQKHPHATPMIVFRKHGSYMASQYRRFVKNGFKEGEKAFFDIENDSGFFKKVHLNYCYQVNFLKEHFTKKPIVLFYEDLRKDGRAFVEDLLQRIGASANFEEVDFSTKHSSYSEKQLRGILAVGKIINLRKRRMSKNGFLHFVLRVSLNFVRYSTLYISKILPASFFSKEPLIDKKWLDDIDTYFDQDWHNVKELAQENN